MSTQENILRNGFAIFSAITSFIFVYYAVGVITAGTASESLKIFAYVAGGYGLFNMYILSWAWRTQASWAVSANLIVAACFFGVLVMDILRNGLQDSKQLGVLAGIAVVLVINWFTIKKLCQK